MGIRDEVLSRPDCAAAYAAKDCQELARLLSIGRTKSNEVEIGNGTILEVLGITAGNAFLDVVAANTAFRYVQPLLDQGRLKIGSPLVQGTVQSMAPTVLTEAQADALCALGLDSDPYTAREVSIALYTDAGEVI